MATSIGTTELSAAISRIRDIMQGKRDYLIQIDGEMGDGDLGITMDKAFTAADEFMQSQDSETDAGKALMQMGMAMAKAAPSTMGTLLATGFMRAGKAVQGKDGLYTADLATAFDAFVKGLMERGKSKAGEKTIIDVMLPAAEALRKHAKASPSEAFEAAYQAAVQGLEETKNMKAQHGRPAYYQEKSLGKPDPGGTAGLYIVQGFKDHFAANEAG
ncbi:MAG: dihydroxyacetone kinase subunit DhaL [Spirochaetaceae bacterium]